MVDRPTAAGQALGFYSPEKAQPRDARTIGAAMQRWMALRLPAARDVQIGGVEVPAANGVANETVLFDATWHDRRGRHTRGFVARIATRDRLFPDVDIALQCRMYRTLAEVPEVPVPAIIGEEDDPSLLDAPFYVMERIDGLVPSDRPHYSFAGWLVDAPPTQRERVWRSAVETLAAIHAVGIGRVDFLARPDLGASGLDQALTAWRRYVDGETVRRPVPVIEAGWEWLLAHRPAPATGLAWGDARISNMIFRDARCVAVLDWDMVSLAGPETDLGWWILQDQGSARRLPGFGTLRDTICLWEELSGRPARDLRWHVAFNAFRLGAIRMRLARQMAAGGVDTPDLARNNVAIQQLALLLGLTPPGPVTATLPEIDL